MQSYHCLKQGLVLAPHFVKLINTAATLEKLKKLKNKCSSLDIQWNLSIVDTTGPRKHVLIREVSYNIILGSQKLEISEVDLYTKVYCWDLLIREVSLFQRLIYTIVTSETVLILISEVQKGKRGVLISEVLVPLYIHVTARLALVC